MSKIKIRTQRKDNNVSLKALISHPMETGLRKNPKAGNFIPAHFITDINITINDKIISQIEMSTAVSKNPYLHLKVKASKGDIYQLSYVDNLGNTGKKRGKIR